LEPAVDLSFSVPAKVPESPVTDAASVLDDLRIELVLVK